MSDGPLTGYGVLVTRPAASAGELVAGIESAGGNAISYPVLEIIGRANRDVADEFARQPDPDIVIFVSRNAVEFGYPVIAAKDVKIAAIGPATCDALERCGATVDITPAHGFDSEHLLQHRDLQQVEGKRVTIVRGETGRQVLGDTLGERRASVRYISAYERRCVAPDAPQLQAIEDAFAENRINCVVIMSVESLKCFLAAVPAACMEKLRETLLVAPGDRVIQTAQNLIPGVPTLAAPGPQAHDIVAALIANRRSGQT